jgi:hypothetical protein
MQGSARRHIGAMALVSALGVASSVTAANHYRLVVEIDPAHDEVRGHVDLQYVNATGADLKSVPIKTHGTGGDAVVESVADGAGTPLRTDCDKQTATCEITLDRPLAPGGVVTFRLKFRSPYKVADGGYRLAAGAWHPKAVAFRDDRFDADEEQPDTYDVDVTLPASETLVTSGTRKEERAGPDRTKRARFAASNVTGFGLASAPDLLSSTSKVVGGVTVTAYYFRNRGTWAPRLVEYAERAIRFYHDLYGYYPQPTLAIMPGGTTSIGGYPAASNIVVVHDTLDRQGEAFAQWIVAHEIGHQYWGWDNVIDSGRLDHWLALGLTLYADRLYCEAHNPRGTKEHRRLIDTYLEGVAQGYDTTLMQTRQQLARLSFDHNNIISHGKGYAVIEMLASTMGRDVFRRLLVQVSQRYRQRYLDIHTFKLTAEEVVGQPLDWFFADWVYGNKVLGYAVDDVQIAPSAGGGSEVSVRIKQTGSASLSLDLEVELEDHSIVRGRVNRDTDVQTLRFQTRARPRRVRLDPENRLALYSPDGKHVWVGDRGLSVIDVTVPEMAWGSNTLQIRLANRDDRPHNVEVDVQGRHTSIQAGGVGWQTSYVIGADQEETVLREFVVKPLPGRFRARVTIRDLSDGVLLHRHDYFGELPVDNPRINPLRRYPPMVAAGRPEYPPFAKVALEHFVIYYLPNDEYTRSRLDELKAERERVYRELVEKLRPAETGRIALILFPDEDTKFVHTGHRGIGWAPGGNAIVEVFNAATRVDPYHELVHILAGSLGNPPALLNEGLAVAFQVGATWNGYHVDAWSKAFETHHLLLPLHEVLAFTEIGSEQSRPAIAYPQAGSFVRYLILTHGFDKVRAAYQTLQRGRDEAIAAANNAKLAAIFGTGIDGLEKGWRTALAESPIPPIPDDVLSKVLARKP